MNSKKDFLDKNDIINLLPHREPMLLIDELTKIVNLKSATAIMNVKKEVVIKNKGLNPEYSGDPGRLLKEIGHYNFIKHSDSIKAMVNFFYKKFSINNDYFIKEN